MAIKIEPDFDLMHKVLALVMAQAGRTEIAFTMEDLKGLVDKVEGKTVVVDARGDRMVVLLVDHDEAQRIEADAAGRPN